MYFRKFYSGRRETRGEGGRVLCSAHDTLDHRVLRFVSVHFFGPQMFRPPTTDLWHFEHVFLAPTHTQSESLMHPLSLPWRFGDQGQSYVAGEGVGGGTGVEASIRRHCWSFVTPSAPRDSPLMYLVPPYICMAVM